MRSRRFVKEAVPLFTLGLLVCLFSGSGFSYAFDTNPISESPSHTATTNPWFELQKRNPYPYTLPLALPNRTRLDGTYTKFEVKETPTVHCRRCPDYAPEGGLWKLRFDKGVFRIYHPDTGWKGIGTFFITMDLLAEAPGGQLLLVNDPVCQETVGLYHWKLEEGQLFLSVIEDPCAIRLRALNLTHLPWNSCRPPCREAAITEHWPKPAGCD